MHFIVLLSSIIVSYLLGGSNCISTSIDSSYNNRPNPSHKPRIFGSFDLLPRECIDLEESYGESLSPGQRRLCQHYPELMRYVKLGKTMALRQCQAKFQHRSWNCSEIMQLSKRAAPQSLSIEDLTRIELHELLKRTLGEDDEDSEETLRNGIEKALFSRSKTANNTSRDTELPYFNEGTREAALRRGLESAGIAYAVAKGCRQDELLSCGCGRSQPPEALLSKPNFVWGGCDDNVRFGLRFAAAFNDVREREQTFPRHSAGLARMLQNLHNNEAGRRSLKRRVRVFCKCHGVSASCNVKTCWHQLQDFGLVAGDIREAYDNAQFVTFNKKGTRLDRNALLKRQKPEKRRSDAEKRRRRRKKKRNARRLRKRRVRYARAVYGKDDLIFTMPTADNCRDVTGRKCSPDKTAGAESCDELCCGRAVKRRQVIVKQSCNCKFQWCCNVRCDTCEVVESHFFCT